MISLLHTFIHHFKQTFPNLNPTKGHGMLLLTVSGGIDSIVLVDLIAKAEFDFIIAHCNFQLRGEESERDEQFVRNLATKYNKPIEVKRFNTKEYAAENNVSIQVAARELRYTWFEELSKQLSLQNNNILCPIVTAHHGDDNIETLLMNFFRGTGIQGLHGIQAQQGNIIRPLLFAKREDIAAYAKDNNLQWVEDSSNASEKYTRNYFRLQLIPALKNIFPAVENNLLQNIQRFSEIELLYNESINTHLKKLLEHKGNEVHIPILKLLKEDALQSIVWEIIKPYNFTAAQVEEVIKLLHAETGSHIASSTHRIFNNRNWIIIAPIQTLEAENILIESFDRNVTFCMDNACSRAKACLGSTKGTLHFETIEINDNATVKMLLDHNILHNQKHTAPAPFTETSAIIDAKEITYPLILRKWKQGDYFYPLGMPKKKKLSRFFIDKKLSALDKEKVWVIESNQKIVWIVGMRIDDRFKVQHSTKNVLKIALSSVKA